jgi:signal transduction histidine kinase
MTDESATERRLVLSMQPATRGERRLAVAVVLVSLAIFAAAAPFARTPLVKLPGFIPVYEAALVVCDLITAALLFGQFAILRTNALLLLACGFLFTAFMAAAHALSFPGLFAEGGVIGGGAQSTAWLYMFWHAGFPVGVIGYALLARRGAGALAVSAMLAILLSVVAVLVLVAALAALATAGEAALPRIMEGNGYTPAMIFVVASVWSLSVLALLVLLARRPRSLLDLWLMVVMCAWLCDVALSAVLNAGRFDLGFYAGRAYGLAAASFVLVVLLLETVALYARLARSLGSERQERERRLGELRSELIHVSRLSELGQMVSALAHEVNQPLTAIANYLQASQRFAQIGEPEKAQAAMAKAAQSVVRATEIIRRLRDFLRKNESEKRSEDLRAVIEDSIALAALGAERPDIETEMRLGPDATAAVIDKIQIQQVLLNLIRNAVEAMAGSARASLVVATSATPEGMVEISVSDTGPGLPAEVRAKLFHPFVTTKSGGMGVGLSICRSIVEAHEGRLWVEDAPGGGTVFKFTLPRAQGRAGREAAE